MVLFWISFLLAAGFVFPGPTIVEAQVSRCDPHGVSGYGDIDATLAAIDSGTVDDLSGVCPTDATVTDGLATIAQLICAYELETINTIFRSNPIREGPPYVYKLCPNSVYNTDGENWLTASLDGTVYKCGNFGSRTDNCVVEGGEFQVILRDNPPEISALDEDRFRLRTVRFEGITFRGASFASIFAFAGPNMTVEFVDCHWMESERALFVRYGADRGLRNETGMKVILVRCRIEVGLKNQC
jgi:hypothetical protein